MAKSGGFDFWRHAESRKCLATKAKHTLLRYGEPRNGQQDENRTLENTLITKDVLKSVWTADRLYKVLRCNCSICSVWTTATSRDKDDELATAIAKRLDRQQLFATLGCMGGIFSMRILERHVFHTLDETLRGMPDRADLIRELFQPFRHIWKTSDCCHPENHSQEQYLTCLREQFLSQMRSTAWIVRVPDFRANQMQHFGEKVSTPFIEENRLAVGNREGREFFRFKVHPGYCDEKLKGRPLFRKQLSIDTPDRLRRGNEESQFVELLKDFSNPNIAEVLFAFQEDQPPRLSLVFEFHPTDLRKLLFDSNSNFKAPKKTVETFPGSILDHWMWIGILGIFDAVAAIHDPLSYITTIPQNARSRVVAGHFDIKPANIIIDDNGRFLLTDFGQAYFKTIEIGQETNFTVYPGTLDYTPPSSYSRRRVINGQIPSPGDWWSREYDVWSLGCVSVEVLSFIVDGADAPGKFYQERLNEDPQRLGTFWMTTGTGELVLKQSVQDRLSGLYQAAHGDQYLIRVVEQIKKMFPLQRSEAKAVKDLHQKLSASVEVDRYLFMGLNDELIAGDHTWACLKELRTSFSTGRVSALRCFLYLWRNPARQRFTLTLEFSGSDRQTIVKPSSTNARGDEVIPLAFFKPDTIFDQNLLRTDGPFLECAFRNMHDGITFQFARRDNYTHFLGAFTYQYVVPGSEFRFRSCSLESAEWTSKRTWSSTEGHLQFWMKLEPDIYFDRYQKKRAPVVPAINLPRSQRLELPQSSRGEDSSSTTSSSISKQHMKDSTSVIPHFRLALYLCGQPNRALVVFSITYDAFDITFDKPFKGHPRMVLKKRSGKDFLAAVIERPVSASMSNRSVPSHTVDDCPGIPMSEQGLSDLMKEELRTVKIEFWNESDQRRFRTYYHTKLNLKE